MIFINILITLAVIFTEGPSNVVVLCGTNASAEFPCRYEGSVYLPEWIINSTTHSVYKLPHNHAYRERVLSVTNITYRQNNTSYQCTVTTGRTCKYYSGIGKLIVQCNGKLSV